MASQRGSVGVWIDNPPPPGSHDRISTRLVGAELVESSLTKGLYGLARPLAAKLPSGLLVEVSCERIATGHFHVGISHSGKLYSMGKYNGPFDVRMFPERHSSYVISIEWKG
jgi:hypothetical protein